jgi:hypothetical protein
MEVKDSGSMQQPAKLSAQTRSVQVCILSLMKRGNSAEAGCPTAGDPVVILNTSCELVYLYIFAYFLVK